MARTRLLAFARQGVALALETVDPPAQGARGCHELGHLGASAQHATDGSVGSTHGHDAVAVDQVARGRDDARAAQAALGQQERCIEIVHEPRVAQEALGDLGRITGGAHEGQQWESAFHVAALGRGMALDRGGGERDASALLLGRHHRGADRLGCIEQQHLERFAQRRFHRGGMLSIALEQVAEHAAHAGEAIRRAEHGLDRTGQAFACILHLTQDASAALDAGALVTQFSELFEHRFASIVEVRRNTKLLGGLALQPFLRILRGLAAHDRLHAGQATRIEFLGERGFARIQALELLDQRSFTLVRGRRSLGSARALALQADDLLAQAFMARAGIGQRAGDRCPAFAGSGRFRFS